MLNAEASSFSIPHSAFSIPISFRRRMHQSNELLRKFLHIAFGLGAFALAWIPWWAAAAVAAGAIIANWLVLHRIVGRSVARHERGFDAGIVLYPVAVLALIFIFRDSLHLAAIGWTTMAFGDGVATLAGRARPIAPLPWNRNKSWGGFVAFIVAGIIGGLAVVAWLGAGTWQLVLAAVFAGAIAESLALNIDDNLMVPAAASLAMLLVTMRPLPIFLDDSAIWLGVNTLLAMVGWLVRSVTVSGAIGGWVLGAVLILFAGWPMYITLLAFFIIGTACTKVGYGRKAAMGLAQEKGGRRGFSHAFSNVGVAAICSLLFAGFARKHHAGDMAIVAYLMGMASLATAAADTVASEIGQLFGKRAFLPTTFKRVPVGTEGAISLEGTLAGAAAAMVVALIGIFAFREFAGSSLQFAWMGIVLVTLAAIGGSWLESVLGSWNRLRSEPIPNGALNFLNTAAGALLVYIACQIAV
jgi:uncharacterized protein (TIGR00297 family)